MDCKHKSVQKQKKSTVLGERTSEWKGNKWKHVSQSQESREKANRTRHEKKQKNGKNFNRLLGTVMHSPNAKLQGGSQGGGTNAAIQGQTKQNEERGCRLFKTRKKIVQAPSENAHQGVNRPVFGSWGRGWEAPKKEASREVPAGPAKK